MDSKFERHGFQVSPWHHRGHCGVLLGSLFWTRRHPFPSCWAVCRRLNSSSGSALSQKELPCPRGTPSRRQPTSATAWPPRSISRHLWGSSWLRSPWDWLKCLLLLQLEPSPIPPRLPHAPTEDSPITLHANLSRGVRCPGHLTYNE